MLIDTQRLRSGAVIESEICIIGGGVAGITLALEFDRAGISACMLESGGVGRHGATADLYDGSSSGIPYDFSDGTRSRFLGGSSNCWGGLLPALGRGSLRSSGLGPRQRLAVRTRGTRAVLFARPRRAGGTRENYEPERWVSASGVRMRARRFPAPPRPYRLPVDPRMIEEIVSHFSPPLKLGQAYREELTRSRHVSVYLWANVTESSRTPGAGPSKASRCAR